MLKRVFAMLFISIAICISAVLTVTYVFAADSTATFYIDANYGGTAVTLPVGNYTLSQLNAKGITNDSISSIKITSGLTVEVYQHDNFGGTVWKFTGDTSYVGADCNDLMSSVKIYSGTAIVTPKKAVIMTKWANDVDPKNPLPEYPRPQLERTNWLNLNGQWQFQSGSSGDAVPIGKNLSSGIIVPYPVESALSGVMQHYDRVWYRRTFTAPSTWSGQRIMLNFGAVDYESEVYVNGKSVGIHKGGYDPFSYDISSYISGTGAQELIVRVYDPTEKGGQPRGKQTTAPGGIMYTPATGIWQTVWLEPVPQTGISNIKIVPNIDNSTVKLTVSTVGDTSGVTVSTVVKDSGTTIKTVTGTVNSEFSVDIANPKLWSPDSPFLYDLNISLVKNGSSIDAINSYFGMRKISLGNMNGYPKMLLNNKFVFQMGPLDQGFWPDGIYTAPTDAALKFDIEAEKELGFNMVRKHIKVEPYRWYYWADKLGILVWQDMPSCNSYISNPPAIDTTAFDNELTKMVQTHWNSPSIISWVIFNEAQGQHNTQNYVSKVKSLDPSRLVNQASGNDHFGVGEIIDIHSYPSPNCPTSTTQAMVCGEYGGVGYSIANHIWASGGGYINVSNSTDYLNTYSNYIDTLLSFKTNKGMSAAVYTQTTDVETELNGILTYDRAVYKADSTKIKELNQKVINKLMYLNDVLLTSQTTSQSWKYTTSTPASNWYTTGFNDSSWTTGKGAFAAGGTPGITANTTWNTADIWMRKSFNPGTLTSSDINSLVLNLYHDENCDVYINGVKAISVTGYTTTYTIAQISQEAKNAIISNGNNIISVHCHQTTGGQGIDVGIAKLTLKDG